MPQPKETSGGAITADRLTALSSGAFTQLETQRGQSLMFGLQAIIAISTLAGLSFRDAKQVRTLAVRRLSGPALDVARQITCKTAEDRMAMCKPLASMVWRMFYETFTAMQAAERGDTCALEAATGVFAAIDRFIELYASASNADLTSAGVFRAARMADPDRSGSQQDRGWKRGRRPDDALVAIPKPNPLTLAFSFLLAANGWWVHGWLGALFAAVGYLALLLLINTAVMRWWPPDDLHQLVRRFQSIKWTLFVAILIATSVAGVSMGSAS